MGRKPKIKEVDLYKDQLKMIEQMPEQMKIIKGWSDEELNLELERLKNLIELSERGKSSRRKGANYENVIAKKFKEKMGITLVRTPMSGGFQKNSDVAEDFRGDINCIDTNKKFLLHLECKNHKAWSVGKWWNQTEEDCPDSKIPALVMHRLQKNEDGKRVQNAEDFVMLRLEDFLDIIDVTKIITTEQKEDGNNDRNSKITERESPSIRNGRDKGKNDNRRTIKSSVSTKSTLRRNKGNTHK